jgi:DNA mismatch repair protein MutS
MSVATPMLHQYMGIKSRHPDAILFYRMGDFYEMFFEDARSASKILGITLTSRGTHNGEKIPMCGVPHHSAKSYIAKLVESGWKVAVCEQTEDPRTAKGIVKREVVRVVTPGSLLEEGEIDSRSNVYLAAVAGDDSGYGLAHADLSTGEFRLTELEGWAQVLDELKRIGPAEILIQEGSGLLDRKELAGYRLEPISGEIFERHRAETVLKEQLGVRSLAGFGCEELLRGVSAAGALVHYLQDTQRGSPAHIKEIATYRLGDYMFLDESTLRNLELFTTLRRQSEKGSLFSILDRTLTPMGTRLLKKWMAYPLLDLREIRKRLGAVSVFRDDPALRERVRGLLHGVYDLERLNGRISVGRANARDLVSLHLSIRKLPFLKEHLADSGSELLAEVSAGIDVLQDIGDLIGKAICDEPPAGLKEGGLIKEGYHADLDRLISITRDGKGWIADLAASEQKRTGISNLKIGYNRVFGYYIELSKSNLHLAPPDYVRRQTLANGERFVTEDLKRYEEMVLGAEEKRIALEYEIFEGVRKGIALENRRIRDTAVRVAVLDVLASLAESADLNGYVCPEVDQSGVIEIVDGRHPVIEQTVRDEPFVPNDIRLDNEEQQLLIITGPNMAGKSTVLRQTALTVLMAQMGGFVPASRARVGLVDRIFTRIGASDDLAKGQSTFMVEMNETANILRHATPGSLVILDEIGRGTSTYDGLSIAWAVAEVLHDRDEKGVKTLFATHYHELIELATTKKRVKNYNIAVKEWKEQIIFLRKLVPGGTSRSYGIQVGRIAGLPHVVIDRAKEILDRLENQEQDELTLRVARGRQAGRDEHLQLALFSSVDQRLRRWISGLDIQSMTPLQALMELNRIKEYLDKKNP